MDTMESKIRTRSQTSSIIRRAIQYLQTTNTVVHSLSDEFLELGKMFRDFVRDHNNVAGMNDVAEKAKQFLTDMEKTINRNIRDRSTKLHHLTFDADEGTVVHIMDTENFKLDIGHIWIPLEKAQKILAMKDEATYVSYAVGVEKVKDSGNWIHRDVDYLIQDIEAAIEADKPGNQIMFLILLSLSAMGIFNAQVLSIFRRGKEIGTLMALGMTRSRVVGLFTLEGGINAVLASVFTAFPFGALLWWTAEHGIPMPMDYSEMGFMIAKQLIPIYSFSLIATTTIIVFFIVIVVSYIPSRRIARMKPTDALRGKTGI